MIKFLWLLWLAVVVIGLCLLGWLVVFTFMPDVREIIDALR